MIVASLQNTAMPDFRNWVYESTSFQQVLLQLCSAQLYAKFCECAFLKLVLQCETTQCWRMSVLNLDSADFRKLTNAYYVSLAFDVSY